MASWLTCRDQIGSHVNPLGVQVWDANNIAPDRPDKTAPGALIMRAKSNKWPMRPGASGWYPDSCAEWFGPFEKKAAEALDAEAKKLFPRGGPKNQAEADYLGNKLGVMAEEINPKDHLARVSWSVIDSVGSVIKTDVPRETVGAIVVCHPRKSRLNQ